MNYKEMKKILLSLVAGMAMAMVVGSCGCKNNGCNAGDNKCTTGKSVCGEGDAERETMFQVASLQSLMIGNYDGFMTVGELQRKGDVGLGTFAAVDGEMIVVDGVVYQARFDGKVLVADSAIKVPFASVTYFDTDSTASFNGVKSLADLTAQLDAVVNRMGQNQIYVVRIDAEKFDSVLVRSELPQHKPYKPLAEALKTDQREFSYAGVGGTIVAVYFPEFFDKQNTPGWHCHFISKDRQKGGHMLNLVTGGEISAQFDATPYFCLYMPSDKAFAAAQLSKDMSKEIEKVEK